MFLPCSFFIMVTDGNQADFNPHIKITNRYKEPEKEGKSYGRL